MSFSLKLFGGASIETPAGPLTGRAAQRHRLALLALLAVPAGRTLSRDKLIGYLWPETASARARHLLSDSIYRINQATGGDTISATGDVLRLDPRILPSDVAAFEGAVGRGDWQDAVDFYSGPFMDGFFVPDSTEFESWAEAERRRLAGEYARALEGLANAAEADGRHADAVRWWRTLAAADMYNARVAIRLMHALEAAGERAAAIQHARTFAILMQQEFGTEPDRALLDLAERLRAAPAAVPEHEPSDDAAANHDHAASSDAASANHDRATSPANAPRSPEPSPTPHGYRPTRPRGRSRRALAAAGLMIAMIAVGVLWHRGATTQDVAPLEVSASMAVLPFADLSPDGDHEYFSDGITEELTNRLAQVEGLRVAARTSAFAFKGRQVDVREVGQQLGVTTVLEGSVRRAGERLRITAQLVNVADGYHIWSDTYEREMEDVFAIQDEIARSIVTTLRGRLVGAVRVEPVVDPAVDPVAYDLYLKGRHSLYLRGRYAWYRRTEDGIRNALTHFQQAVEVAPDYARAHAGLADAYAVLGFYDYLPPAQAFPNAEAAAERALEIEPGLAAPHSTLGYVALYYRWDWERAEVAFRRSIQLDSSYSTAHQWYANYLTAMGRFDDAEREMRLAQELDPLSLIANAALGWVHFYAGDYERAIEQCRQTLALDDEYAVALLWSGWALEALGRYDEAIATHSRAVTLTSRSAIYVAALARTHALMGQRTHAERLLREIDERARRTGYVPSYEIAKVHDALGDRDAAMQWLERAFDERSHSMVFLKVDPQLQSMQDDPRFVALVRRVGLR